MGPRILSTVLAGVLLATGAAGCSADGEPAPAHAGATQEWRRLPAAPLSPRDDAVVVGFADRALVVGGWEFVCPPNADCSTPQDPLLDDGAVYDATTDSWSAIAPPPFGLRSGGAATAGIDGTAYLVTGCAAGPACDAQPRLLSYGLADDRWTDHGPVPGPDRGLAITALGQTLVVYTDSNALGRVPDLVFDPERSTWTELPADPLPAVVDRFIVPVGDQLVLAGSAISAPGSSEGPRKLLARLGLASGEWFALPDGPGQAYQLFPTDRGPLLAGHFGDTSSSWLLDPGSWTWSALPEHGSEGAGVSGVLDSDRAAYDLANTVGGWSYPVRVYDSVRDTFVTIPPAPGRDSVFGESSTALGRDLFVYGGQRWTGDDRADDGELLGDALLWTAPTD